MPFYIVKNDITRMKVDAIVNAANESLLGGGGVDGAIHRAAGPELLRECRTLGGCKTGEAKLTSGYHLPAQYVIHTVGPVWHGGGRGERELLVSAYRSSLELALAHGCQTVAFPLISSGVYGYPKAQALEVAVDTIQRFLLSHDIKVYLAIFQKTDYDIGQALFDDIAALIEARYVQGDANDDSTAHFLSSKGTSEFPDESFSQMLLRKKTEAGLAEALFCQRANIQRSLFSEMTNNINYMPSKPLAVACAVALELPMEETQEMLKKAGFFFSRASKSDIITQYFMERRNYNIFKINEALFAFDQPLLGA